MEDRLAQRGGLVECLRLPAALFSAVAGLRSRLYDRGWLPQARLGVPVICVGNLSVGGTGKTPMVVWVTRALQERGRRPGLLSRGYGSEAGKKNDEALELERALPGIPHIQNPDRVAGGRELEKLGVDVIVMDDGFQHRRLERDLDLVLVDATRPWGVPYPTDGGAPVCATLPRGLLREGPAALARAGALVITRADQAAPERLEALREKLESLAPGVPIIETIHSPAKLRAVRGPELDLDGLRGRKLDLFSGIGNPAAFEQSARALGAEIVEHRCFADHQLYSAEDLAGIGSDRAVLTTAKDIVKCDGLLDHCDELYVLEVELSPREGIAVIEALFDSLGEGFAARNRAAIHAGLHG